MSGGPNARRHAEDSDMGTEQCGDSQLGHLESQRSIKARLARLEKAVFGLWGASLSGPAVLDADHDTFHRLALLERAVFGLYGAEPEGKKPDQVDRFALEVCKEVEVWSESDGGLYVSVAAEGLPVGHVLEVLVDGENTDTILETDDRQFTHIDLRHKTPPIKSISVHLKNLSGETPGRARVRRTILFW